MAPKRQTSGRHTAKLAIQILLESKKGYQEPTASERINLAIAFAKRKMTLYSDGFDVVKCRAPVSLSEPEDIEKNMNRITICEVKSTRLSTIGRDLRNYFFSLSTSELLSAQNLRKQYRFVFVNTSTREIVELSLHQFMSKVRILYPEWAIRF